MGVQADRAAKYSKKTFELEQRRTLDMQLLNALTDEKKNKIRKLVSDFDIRIWFDKEESKFNEKANNTKKHLLTCYTFRPSLVGTHIDYNESFAFCYFLLPKFKRFFKNKEGYFISDTLDDENRIILKIQGTIPLKWYERIIHCY